MARSRSIGNVYAELSVKDKMTAGLNRAQKSLGKFADKVASIGSGLVLAAPAAALAGLTVSMKSAIDAGGKLSDMMAQTGADGEQLFVMQRAFENAGIAGDKVPGVLNKMQKALAGVNEEGERVLSRVFTDLGLSVEQLRSMDPAAAFKSLSQSIAAIPDPAKRAALAMEIFGRSGGELLVVMNDGKAFENAAQQVGGLGATLAANADKLDKVSDSLELLGVKAQQVGAEVAVELLPHLESLANFLNELDLGGVTSQAIEFAKAMGGIADKASLITSELPVLKQIKGVFGLAESGIAALAANDPMAGTALPAPNYTLGGDPLANYNEGIMVRELKDFTETIPDMLKLRPELVAGMTMEESGIPGMAGIIDAIRASVAPIEGQEPTARAADFKETQFDVNELQARGLGYGGENIAKEANRQVSLLTEIRDVLKLASTDGTLNWN